MIDGPRYHEQPGWNAGYLCGEQERLALATALDATRYDHQQALERCAELETLLAGRDAAHHDLVARIADLEADTDWYTR